MSKIVVLNRDSDIEGYRETLRTSAESSQLRISELAGSSAPLEFLYRLKFEGVGCDPIDPARGLNLIEQLNQTFTYLASFNGAEFLFLRHPKVKTLTLNLGTKNGWDIEATDDGGVIAEVSATVTPRNNSKLAKDMKKVASSNSKHRYVFFMSPRYPTGPYSIGSIPLGVIVWSLGFDI